MGETVVTIKTKPQPKQRPRSKRIWKNGKPVTITYTPKETVEYENKVRTAYKEQNGLFYGCPVEAEMIFRYAPPESWSKKKKSRAITGELFKTTKPDIDNLIKAVTDAINNDVAYKDDSYLIRVIAVKEYAEEDEIVLKIREYGDEV